MIVADGAVVDAFPSTTTRESRSALPGTRSVLRTASHRHAPRRYSDLEGVGGCANERALLAAPEGAQDDGARSRNAVAVI